MIIVCDILVLILLSLYSTKELWAQMEIIVCAIGVEYWF